MMEALLSSNMYGREDDRSVKDVGMAAGDPADPMSNEYDCRDARRDTCECQ